MPYDACSPGSTTSAHGSRPQRRHRWCAPAGMPGTATVPAPISYGIRCPTKITSISVAGSGPLAAQSGHADEEVDAADLSGRRVVDGGEPAAAQSGEDRLRRAADQHHGDGGVHRVAAGGQHVRTRLRGHRVAGGDAGEDRHRDSVASTDRRTNQSAGHDGCHGSGAGLPTDQPPQHDFGRTSYPAPLLQMGREHREGPDRDREEGRGRAAQHRPPGSGPRRRGSGRR